MCSILQMYYIHGILFFTYFICFVDTFLVPICSENGGVCKIYLYNVGKKEAPLIPGFQIIQTAFSNLMNYIPFTSYVKEPPPPLTYKEYLLKLLKKAFTWDEDESWEFQFLSSNSIVHVTVLLFSVIAMGLCLLYFKKNVITRYLHRSNNFIYSREPVSTASQLLDISFCHRCNSQISIPRLSEFNETHLQRLNED